VKSIQKKLLATMIFSFLVTGLAEQALAAYGNVNTSSDVDPEVVKVKELDFLGVKVSGDYRLVDSTGREFTLKEFQAGKPMVLALSYYSCDGSCPVLNRNLKNTLSGVDDWELGKDFKVLTVSFDKHDTPEAVQKFLDYSQFEDVPEGWAITTLKDGEDIKRLTDSIGYKFFWSPRDAMFLHPSVYVMLSPEGRVTRYLYGATISPDDMEISLTKALAGKTSEANVINFIVGACYSYNYEDGKYSINYPLFIALGALGMGLTMLAIGSLVLIRKRRRTSI